jgi:hypothetical protein
MADTVLPSIATVNDEQLAALLWCYTDVAGFKAAMVQHMINDIRSKRQAEIQVSYNTALTDLRNQEQAAMVELELMLANLVNPTVLDNPPE